MAIVIDRQLPAFSALLSEGFQVRDKAETMPDISIGLINLMPLKDETEKDFMRIIAPACGNIGIELINMTTHRRSRNTPQEHIDRFYTDFSSVADRIDGVIVTGAPLEDVAFEDVDYWREITSIFDALHSRSTPTFYVCWGAFAALWHWWRIPMKHFKRKISGIFPGKVLTPDSPLLQGIADRFDIPVSRYVSWADHDIESAHGLIPLTYNPEAGYFLLESASHPEWFMTGHGEYNRLTLHNEYVRDLGRGLDPHIPDNYYPADDPEAAPRDRWSETARQMISNWLGVVSNAKLNKGK